MVTHGSEGTIGTDFLDVETPLGPARATLTEPVLGSEPVGLLVLGHGAGGGIEAADLVAISARAAAAGWTVARVEQPWRVAGKKVAPAPARLDVGWLPVLAALAPWRPDGAPLVVGGRSAGARVACRTAGATAASAVCCLSFPLHPPGRPERSRSAELALPVAAGLPVLVVQGVRDPFGTADDVVAVAPAGVRVVPVPGGHGLRAGADEAAHAVTAWLADWPADRSIGRSRQRGDDAAHRVAPRHIDDQEDGTLPDIAAPGGRSVYRATRCRVDPRPGSGMPTVT